MRIVVDLPQYKNKNNFSLPLIKALLLQQINHDLRLTFNNYHKDTATIDAIHKELEGLSPLSAFSYYSFPELPSEYQAEIASELIYYHFSQLNPDVLLFSGIFDFFGEHSSSILNRLFQLPRTLFSLLIDDCIDLFLKQERIADGLTIYKHINLDFFDVIVTFSEKISSIATNELGISKNKVLLLTSELHAKDIDGFLQTYQTKYKEKFSYVRISNQKKRIAYFSPLPTQESGISDYTAELLPALTKFWQIDVFTDNESPQFRLPEIKIYPQEIFSEISENYDAIIYQFGNSRFHNYMYDFSQEYPGFVVMHDFFLAHMMVSLDEQRQKDFFANELVYSHGENAASGLKSHSGKEKAMMHFPCNKRILEGALGIISHSPYIDSLLAQHYPTSIIPPLQIIPQLHELNALSEESSKKALKSTLGFNKDDFLICSFGFLAPTKLCDLLIEGFINSVLINHARVKLLLVGALPARSDYERKVNQIINSSGYNKKITITGYISAERYKSILKIADIAVQLRSNSRGETSRAVLDCLSCGIPLIINDYATFRDYPENIVYRIDENPTPEIISQAISLLYGQRELRTKLSKLGHEYVAENHNPITAAQNYVAFIEELLPHENYSLNKLKNNLAEILHPHCLQRNNLKNIAEVALYNKISTRPRRILFDNTDILRNDWGTGIHRLVHVLANL